MCRSAEITKSKCDHDMKVNLQEGRNWGFLSWNRELKLLQWCFGLHGV